MLCTGTRFSLQNFQDAPLGNPIFVRIFRMLRMGTIFFKIFRTLRTGTRFSSKFSGCSARGVLRRDFWKKRPAREHDFVRIFRMLRAERDLLQNSQDAPHGSAIFFKQDDLERSKDPSCKRSNFERRRRRILHQSYIPESSAKYLPLQTGKPHQTTFNWYRIGI